MHTSEIQSHYDVNKNSTDANSWMKITSLAFFIYVGWKRELMFWKKNIDCANLPFLEPGTMILGRVKNISVAEKINNDCK